MKLSHVIQAVYFSPWNISREGWQSVHAVVRPYLIDPTFKFESKFNPDGSIDETADLWGNPIPQYELLDNGIAIVPVSGVLMNHASLMDKQCGACGYQDIKSNIQKAIDDGAQKVRMIVESPGGMAQGSHELGAWIDSMTSFIDIEAYTDGLMCSAAYDICCGVNRIYATQSAMVGCIGSMCAFLDESVRYEMEGYKMEVFKTGPFKGAGTPGTSLSDAQRAQMQATVDKFGGMFKARVARNRLVEDSTMQGQSFIGSDAVDVGLVDELIDDIEAAYE